MALRWGGASGLESPDAEDSGLGGASRSAHSALRMCGAACMCVWRGCGLVEAAMRARFDALVCTPGLTSILEMICEHNSIWPYAGARLQLHAATRTHDTDSRHSQQCVRVRGRYNPILVQSCWSSSTLLAVRPDPTGCNENRAASQYLGARPRAVQHLYLVICTFLP
jgi:hypothetical protein